MRKYNMKKLAAAAAFICLAAAGGASVYAATNHSSLLSLFTSESGDVQDQAARLLDKDVVQTEGENKKQSDLATFEIREALCDANRVIVQIAVKAAEPEKYLLIPQDCIPETDSVQNLGFKNTDLDETMKIQQYAKSMGKKCLRVSAGVDCKADSQSIDNSMEEDGTLIYTISFQNREKIKNLNYTCRTCVSPAESTDQEDDLKDTIQFSLTDKSEQKTVTYLPKSAKKIDGTNLIVDKVVFSQSNLETYCSVKYHYAGQKKDWMNTTDADICFFMLDDKGEIIETKGGEGTQLDGTSALQTTHYALQDLPDTITFVAKDVFEKDIYGTVDVSRTKRFS